MRLRIVIVVAMLRRWFVEDKGDTYAYQWEENEAVVIWMEEQKKKESTVNRNINAVKKDAIISKIQQSLEVKNQYLTSLPLLNQLEMFSGMSGSRSRCRCRFMPSFAANTERGSCPSTGTT